MSQMTKNITRLSLSKHFYSRKVCLYVLFFSKFSFSYAFQIICIKLTCWTKCFANGNHNIRFSAIVVTKNTPTKTSWKRLAIWLRTKRQKRPKADIQKQEIEDRQAIPWKKNILNVVILLSLLVRLTLGGVKFVTISTICFLIFIQLSDSRSSIIIYLSSSNKKLYFLNYYSLVLTS